MGYISMTNKDLSSEQIYMSNRIRVIDSIAREAGFDEDAFAATEFSLIPFFELVVEYCAQVAENHAKVYTGEKNEGAGCHGAANAIRNFSKTIGNEYGQD